MSIAAQLLGSALLGLLAQALLVTSWICSDEIYGRVNAYDCHMAIGKIPFAQLPASHDAALNIRQFSEPQFQNPKFGALENHIPSQAIVQLPKMWKHSESNPVTLSSAMFLSTYHRVNLTDPLSGIPFNHRQDSKSDLKG